MNTATARFTWATSKAATAWNRPGTASPRATPAIIASPTQTLRKRSKNGMDYDPFFLTQLAVNFLHRGDQAERFDVGEIQRRQLFQAVAQALVGALEHRVDLFVGTLGAGRVGDAPVHLGGLGQPHRAGFAGGGVAHRNDHVEALAFQVVHGFGRRLVHRHTVAFQHRQGAGVHLPGGLAAGAAGADAAFAEVIGERLAENRPAGVAGTQKQHVQGQFHGSLH